MSWHSGQRPCPDRWGKSAAKSPREFRGMDAEPTSRDRRFDTPLTVMGEFRRTKWWYRPTEEDDQAKAAYVDALCARYRH